MSTTSRRLSAMLAAAASALVLPTAALAQEYPPSLGVGDATVTETRFEPPAVQQTGTLPFTGQEVAALAAAGGVAVLGGAALVALARRRRPADA